MIRRESPRCSAVFMDHMMPKMDGNEEMFLSRGFQDFIPKPINMERLDAALRRWVRDKSREAEAGAVPSGAERAPGNADASPGGTGMGGIDREKALERFSGDEAVLRDVLRSYARSTRPLLRALREHLEAGDLPGYAIAVHGVKGSSYGIQALEVGRLAEGLELAAKAGDMDAVRAGHGLFEKTAEALLDELDRAPGGIGGEADKPVAPKPDPALLRELRDACAAFDMDRVDAALEKLESFRYESGGELVARLRGKVADMAFEEIAAMGDA